VASLDVSPESFFFGEAGWLAKSINTDLSMRFFLELSRKQH